MKCGKVRSGLSGCESKIDARVGYVLVCDSVFHTTRAKPCEWEEGANTSLAPPEEDEHEQKVPNLKTRAVFSGAHPRSTIHSQYSRPGILQSRTARRLFAQLDFPGLVADEKRTSSVLDALQRNEQLDSRFSAYFNG